ncbi:vWA domain-containing protein [Pseudofrankia sp. EUN1h]|uniref:vWA domain-containing protein n=1 Tax=Pseudofrankia sp. EUN1h TaxID=1834515 RepID=UPI001300DE69|nr:vWA domain-containing protein [Pseudofrankia sp. EUN1h]
MAGGSAALMRVGAASCTLILALGLAAGTGAGDPAAAATNPGGDGARLTNRPTTSPDRPEQIPTVDTNGGPKALGPQHDPDQRPVDQVVLVDESGSLDDQAMALEKQAIGLIAATDLGEDDRLAVIGFGSPRGQNSGTDTHCALAAIENTKKLSSCLGKIHRRTTAEGNNTDYRAALKAATSALTTADQSGEPRRRIVYLLTDGFLDLDNDQSDKSSPDDLKAAGEIVDTILPDISWPAGVEFWPIAVGKRPHRYSDPAGSPVFALDKLVGHGAPAGARVPAAPNCGSTPAERRVIPWLADSGHLTMTGPDGLLTMLAAARCTNWGARASGPAGARVTVTIPAGTAEATITVLPQAGGTSASQPRFLMPDADGNGGTRPAPDAGAQNGGLSAYLRRSVTVAGTGTVVSLRITNPPPGAWTVTSEQPITVVPSWSVSASLDIDGLSPTPGTEVPVKVVLAGQRDSFGNRGLMDKVMVRVRLAGQGDVSLSEKESPFVPLGDDGPGGVERSGAPGDGVYGGAVTVPSGAQEPLVFVAEVSGSSLGVPLCPGRKDPASCAQTTFVTSIAGGVLGAALWATFDDALPATVQPGGDITGTVTLSGVDQANPPKIFLQPANVDPRMVTVGSDPQPAGPGLIRIQYTLHVAEDAPPGPLRGLLEVDQLADERFTRLKWRDLGAVTVQPSRQGEPAQRADGQRLSTLSKALIGVVALLVLIMVCVFAWLSRRSWLALWRKLLHRPTPPAGPEPATPPSWADSDHGIPATGLTVYLWVDGARGDRFVPRDPAAVELAFSVSDEDGGRLIEVEPDRAEYRIRRAPGGIEFRRRSNVRWQEFDWDWGGMLPVSGSRRRLELSDERRGDEAYQPGHADVVID